MSRLPKPKRLEEQSPNGSLIVIHVQAPPIEVALADGIRRLSEQAWTEARVFRQAAKSAGDAADRCEVAGLAPGGRTHCGPGTGAAVVPR